MTLQPHWYAAYTCANQERRVAEQLGRRGIEHFLPNYESVRKWKDRRVRLLMPLFPGYVFVHVALSNRLGVLQVPGVVQLVAFNGHPAPIPEHDLARIRGLLDKGLRAEPHPYLKKGQHVRVEDGPFAGMEGVIIRRQNGTRFVISFEFIRRSIAVELNGANLRVRNNVQASN